jgi:hypothetical protein
MYGASGTGTTISALRLVGQRGSGWQRHVHAAAARFNSAVLPSNLVARWEWLPGQHRVPHLAAEPPDLGVADELINPGLWTARSPGDDIFVVESHC